MTTVTLNETPSELAVKPAQTEFSVIDANGRVIKLKKPGILSQYRLVEALGESAKNEIYMGMVLPIIYVTAIDDDVIYQPSSKREVEALIQRLDEDGIAAVMAGVNEHFNAQNIEAEKEALKKS